MKLVVDHALSPEDGAPSPATAGERPGLRLIQGGRVRPRHLAAPRPPEKRAAAAEPEPEPVIDFDEMPIVLRPIPAWVPRLW